MSAGRVLITGADGYLGFRLARRFLQDTNRPVVLWVRAEGDEEFAAKRARITSRLGAQSERADLHWGDLTREDPFATVSPEGIEILLHAAAVTRFNVDAQTADRVNVMGTAKVLAFAERCPGLQTMGLLSTVYASGLTPGPIEERPLDRPVFANHYERSKWESESLLLEKFDHLPWQIFRVATVIADDESGSVTQQNAFHNTLRLLYYGLLSLIPGAPETPVYLVTGRFVEDSLFELAGRPKPRTIYHLAHTREESPTLDTLLELAFLAFQQDEGFRSRRILKPVYADSSSFALLAEGVRAFGGEVVTQAVASVSPFAHQLYVTKEIRNERLRQALPGYAPPDMRRLLQQTCAFLVRTRWGRDVSTSAG